MGCMASTPEESTNIQGYVRNPDNDKSSSNVEQNERLQDSKLDKMLQQRKSNNKNQIKMLLLGTGESGKSTVLKQMRLLHKNGFSMQERNQYKNIIWADCVASMQNMIIQSRNLNIELNCDDPKSDLYDYKQKILMYKPLNDIDTNVAGGETFLKEHLGKYSERSAKNRKLSSNGLANAGWMDERLISGGDGSSIENSKESDDLIREYLDDTISSVNEPEVRMYSALEVAEAISKIWTYDSGVKKCFAKSNLFQFEPSAPYFFERATDYADEDYICTDEDILKGRIKTTGITETNFNINGIKFKIFDAGGQRSERKKWIHCFQDITCATFVLAVSEYDQMLFEDERVNRMHEAIILFDSLVNSKWFANTPFILFLNKVDLLKDKVRKSPVRKYFPDYPGKSNDVEDTLQYFERLFLSLNRSNRPIYVHRTCATDTKSMQFILTAVTDMVIQQNLKKSGLF